MATLRTATRVEPKATTKQTATTTTEVKLETSLKTKLLKFLRQHAEVSARMKADKATKETLASKIRGLRESTGASSLAIDGFTITDTGGDTFDKEATQKKLQVMYGLTLEQVQAAWVMKPKKRYDKITAPGGGDE